MSCSVLRNVECAGPYTFQRYESWNRPGLQPAPSNALKLLHRLAADKGIIGVMAKHRYTVGALTEMPPTGKVGVSPVCILGVNINSGATIYLQKLCVFATIVRWLGSSAFWPLI